MSGISAKHKIDLTNLNELIRVSCSVSVSCLLAHFLFNHKICGSFWLYICVCARVLW